MNLPANFIEMKNPKSGFPIDFTNAAQKLNRYKDTVKEATLISGIIPFQHYPRVLDIFCGFGRISAELHSLGHEVTGIDISEQQIELAQRQNPGPTYILADMRSPPAGPFDAIVNMFTSFGYFDSEIEDIDTLEIWSKKLREGGVLIMELADMECARAKLPKTNSLIIRKSGSVTEHCLMDWERRIFCVTYIQGESKFTCYTRLYEKELLKTHLLNAGFSTVDLFGSLSLRAKEPEDNLIVIATK